MIVARKVWEFGKNAIWDDGKYYILEHVPTGKKAYFDREDRVLKAVQRKIKQRGSVSYNKSLNLSIFKSEKGDSIYLSQLLYSAYHRKPLSWVRNGRVRILDGNCDNLTSNNLVHTHENADDNPNRCVYQAGDYIFLLHKKSGRTYFCRNDPELFKLLCNHQFVWSFLKKSNRLQATITRNGQEIDNLNPYFHQIVYAFEHYGARRNNFIGKLRKMQTDLAKNELTIDHLDDSQENAMPWNLSLMSKSQNSAKSNMLG